MYLLRTAHFEKEVYEFIEVDCLVWRAILRLQIYPSLRIFKVFDLKSQCDINNLKYITKYL